LRGPTRGAGEATSRPPGAEISTRGSHSSTRSGGPHSTLRRNQPRRVFPVGYEVCAKRNLAALPHRGCTRLRIVRKNKLQDAVPPRRQAWDDSAFHRAIQPRSSWSVRGEGAVRAYGFQDASRPVPPVRINLLRVMYPGLLSADSQVLTTRCAHVKGGSARCSCSRKDVSHVRSYFPPGGAPPPRGTCGAVAKAQGDACRRLVGRARRADREPRLEAAGAGDGVRDPGRQEQGERGRRCSPR